MDEMDEYRDRIERRYKDRRRSIRRGGVKKQTAIDLDFILCMVVLLGFAALLLTK